MSDAWCQLWQSQSVRCISSTRQLHLMPACVRHTSAPMSLSLFSGSFSLPLYHRFPRMHRPSSAGDVSNTALAVMSVQQLEAVNDSRWTLVSLKWGRRASGLCSTSQVSVYLGMNHFAGCFDVAWVVAWRNGGGLYARRRALQWSTCDWLYSSISVTCKC